MSYSDLDLTRMLPVRRLATGILLQNAMICGAQMRSQIVGDNLRDTDGVREKSA